MLWMLIPVFGTSWWHIKMAGQLNGKTALVTGGRQGIGRGIADRFVAEGATVHITGRGARPTDLPDHFAWTACDVSDAAQVADLAAGFDGLDILVNNAAEQHPQEKQGRRPADNPGGGNHRRAQACKSEASESESPARGGDHEAGGAQRTIHRRRY